MINKNFTMTESEIANEIGRNQSMFCTSYDILIPNCYTSHDNEADVFAIRRSGLCDEFEIKISRSDFFNDAKKKVQVRDIERWSYSNPSQDQLWLEKNQIEFSSGKIIAPWQKLKHQALSDGDMTANYFWYVIKLGEVAIDEIPDFAGVIFINNDGKITRQRSPKKLHNSKIDDSEKYRLSKKLAYRYWEYRLGKR